MYPPAALQALADGHDTPLIPLPAAPAGFGVAWMVHAVPFHRSASGAGALVVLLVTAAPAAVQARAEVHDTAPSSLPEAPAGFGVAWMVHVVPFQRSASVADTPEAALTKTPAAVQASGALHDTPCRTLLAPAGAGTRLRRHVEPFHASASGSVRPVLPVESPTAMHALAEGQDTANSPVAVAPPGAGVAWML